jgi:hypothetical protein
MPNQSEADTRRRAKSLEANESAMRRIAAVEPVLTGFDKACDALDLRDGELGHAGPPFLSRESIPPPVLSALAGAALHER